MICFPATPAFKAGGHQPRITLSGSRQITENTAAGALVGALAVVNAVGTPTFTLETTAGSKFAQDGDDIETGATATNYETDGAAGLSITVSVSGVDPDPPDAVFHFEIMNVLEVSLGALNLDALEVTENAAVLTVIGAITGGTSGSTIDLYANGGGRAAKLGSNIVVGATLIDYEDVGLGVTHIFNITLRETHADATAPGYRDTVLTIQVLNETGDDPDVTSPTFTSSDAVSVEEDQPLSHTLTADEPATFQIIGGADAAHFEIVSLTTLRFADDATKDFDNPTDANVDGVYVVIVRATDPSSNAANQTISVTVTQTTAEVGDLDFSKDGNIAATVI